MICSVDFASQLTFPAEQMCHRTVHWVPLNIQWVNHNGLIKIKHVVNYMDIIRKKEIFSIKTPGICLGRYPQAMHVC
jgi:hypothetical protein